MKIIEKKSNIDLTLPKFNCDQILSHQISPNLPRHHHNWIFSGKPASGKTSLALSLLTSRGKKKQYRGVFDNIYVIMPQSSINSLERNPFKEHDQNKMFHELTEEVLDNIIDQLQENATWLENSLIVCDDFASSLKNPQLLRQLNHLCANRRHYRVSLWFLVQGIRFLPRSFRRLITHVSLWKFNHQDEMKQIKEELSPLPSKQMDEVFRFTFRNKHDFLFMDLATQKLYRNFNKLIILDEVNRDAEKREGKKTSKGKENASQSHTTPKQ